MTISGQKILVVGKKGSGKTAYLEFLSRSLKKKGKKVGGFLCLNDIHGSKSVYRLYNLKNYQSWMLASRKVHDQLTIQYGEYYFNPKVFEIGNRILEESVNCTAIIVDEYGPLEREQQGFYQGIRFLLNNFTGILIIATRPATLLSLKKLLLTWKSREKYEY